VSSFDIAHERIRAAFSGACARERIDPRPPGYRLR
jgi:hypothetical protein